MQRAAIALSVTALLCACQKQVEAPKPLTQTEAAAIADATQAAWTSVDLAKEEAPYSKDVHAFDPMEAQLSSDWDTFDAWQKGFINMKFNGISVPDRKIQVLDADTFIVSGTGDLTSTDGEMKQATMRFTDVYQRQADGNWLIVNEHVSFKPEKPKTEAAEPAAAPAQG